jgi:Zn-finger nucleic acid-binding protein
MDERIRTCPVSHTRLYRETRHGIEIDVGAEGIWLDKGELLLLTEAARHQASTFEWADLFRREIRPPADRHRRLECPICAQPMKLEVLHGVTIDWCPDHGVWLDTNELDAILNNLRLDPLFVNKVATRLGELKF